MAEQARQVVVIGNGIVGCCCAWHLVRRGFDVTIVDPQEPGSMTSFGNAGCVTPGNIVPFSHPGTLRQLPSWMLRPGAPVRVRWRQLPALTPWLWRYYRSGRRDTMRALTADIASLMHDVHADWQRDLAACEGQQYMRADGGMAVYQDARMLVRDQWQFDLRREHGYPSDIISAAEAREREPALALGDGGAARWFADWRHIIDPGGVTRHFAEAALAGGARWLRERVTRLQPGAQGMEVQTESGSRLQPGKVVLAAGVWSRQLSEPLDGPLPLAPKRGYHLLLPEPGVALRQPLLIADDFFIATPMAAGVRLAGTAEFDRLDAPPDERRARHLLGRARRFLPGLDGSNARAWMGQRPMMADSKPVIGASPKHPGLIYAFGHGHYGLTQGPTTGRLVADLAEGRSPELDLAPFRYDRFRTGN